LMLNHELFRVNLPVFNPRSTAGNCISKFSR
jgi:hypothetical protein